MYYKRCKRPAYTTTGIMLMLIYQKGYMSLGHCDLLVSVTVFRAPLRYLGSGRLKGFVVFVTERDEDSE